MRHSSASRAAVRTTIRRAATIAASAVLLIGPLTATANAAPADQTPDLPPELVEAVQRDLGLTPEQYLERAARAQELNSYARDFRAERPSDFAGAWMSDDGNPVVAVTNRDAARQPSRTATRPRSHPSRPMVSNRPSQNSTAGSLHCRARCRRRSTTRRSMCSTTRSSSTSSTRLSAAR